MKLLSLWTYIMTMLLRLSLITLCIYVLSSWLVHADVWFIEAEGFEEKRSILVTNQKGVNVQWSIKEGDKKALGKKYLTVEGANRNNCEACAPLFYPISNFSFDGIPRSEVQRESLEKLLAKNSRDFTALEIKLTNEEALQRLIIRASCNECGNNFGSEEDLCPKCGSEDVSRRNDDNPDAIMNRLKNFDEYTSPLLEEWEKSAKLVSVNGEQDIADVSAEIFAALEDKEEKE